MTKLVWNVVEPVEFFDVVIGAVFEWDGQVFLKVGNSKTTYNAFSFKDKCLAIFTTGDKVEVLDCELYLTRRREK